MLGFACQFRQFSGSVLFRECDAALRTDVVVTGEGIKVTPADGPHEGSYEIIGDTIYQGGLFSPAEPRIEPGSDD